MSAPVLAARDLSASAGSHRLLDGVDLDVRAGRVLVVLGESGSGKTTLGLALQGEPPRGTALVGSARLRGTELLGIATSARRAARAGVLGYLPQHPAAALDPARRVGKVLAELAALRHRQRAARREAIQQALQAARLPAGEQVLRRYPHQLSGGQQQRAALAQVLITDPEVVVLDEPTTGLDTAAKARTADALAALAAGGTALVVLTHELGLARELAHEVLVLQRGRAVEHGPAARLLRAPEHEHSRALLAAEPRLPEPSAAGAPREVPAADQEEVPVLTAEGLGKTSRGGARVLAEVDLSVQRGRHVAIAGPSGAGKSTLGRCLAGLTSADAGRLRLHGSPLPAAARRRTADQRRRVQYVHQDARSSFDEHRPVLDQVARTARLLLRFSADESRRAALAMLASLGLHAPHVERRPDGLSGGQLRRAALARSLLAHPDVLVCDEITASLDAVTRAELLDVLARTAASTGTSLVVISHDFAALSSIAEEVHVLERGRCVETAATGALLARPRSAAAVELVAAASRNAGAAR
ncbi:ABC transporter ATP-binding protein [Salinifilum aidingensis]